VSNERRNTLERGCGWCDLAARGVPTSNHQGTLRQPQPVMAGKRYVESPRILVEKESRKACRTKFLARGSSPRATERSWGLLHSRVNLVPDGARKSRHVRRPAPRRPGRSGAMPHPGHQRRGAVGGDLPRRCAPRAAPPDPAQHEEINFSGTCSFDVETGLRREGHRPLRSPAA
jgi:hypothetical protein